MNSYNNLSLRDLVEARDMFHAHLINKRNVVATAVGRYLVRMIDIGEDNQIHRRSKNEPRQLDDSVVVDSSWPCILVFVEQWEEPDALIGNERNDLVPKTIYMPDGRMVPVCTVLAAKQEINEEPPIQLERLRFPENLIGGGYPLLVNSQGIDLIASVGCVVTDGHKYFALSNQHVTGGGGQDGAVFSKFGIDRQRIGFASGISLGNVPFSRLYPGWTVRDVLVKCDVGLIEIENVNRWKTDIFDIGSFDEMLDLNTINMDLNLIATHKRVPASEWENHEFATETGRLVAYGAVSGRMEGEISALFYRYKSVGGTEFVSDFLISGRVGTSLRTHHGDSGTLWLYEEPPQVPQSPVIPSKDSGAARSRRRTKDTTLPTAKGVTLRPIALHWGQQDFFAGRGESGRKEFGFALGTCLSNVCRELDVDLVRGWNVDSPYTWGKVGHYTVAAIAVTFISNGDLRGFMEANLENVTFFNDKINAGLDVKDNPDLPKDPKQGKITPLADVPDIIWKQSKKTTDYGRMGDENPNHYADADAPSTGGETLFELCDTKDKLTVEVWSDYYKNIKKESIGLDPYKDVSQGLICFRVWQIYDYMIAAMNAPKKSERAAQFIFAAGVLAHYVGDACQPLHSSYVSNGDPADTTTIDYVAKRTSKNHEKGEHYPKDVNPGNGVHTAYEDHMIDDKIDAILPQIPNSSANDETIAAITDGQSAGFNVLTLMKKTQETIHPKDIVEVFKAAKDSENVSDALFEQFGQGTIDCLARGARHLAAIWDAAWTNGDGSTKITNRGKVNEQPLIDLYSDRAQLPSKHLDTISDLLVKS